MFKSKTKKTRAERAAGTGNIYLEMAKALIIALIITLALVIVFALLIKFLNIPQTGMTVGLQVIKVAGLLAGCIFGFKTKSGGWKKGVIVGLVYVILAFIIFSLLDGKFSFSPMLCLDILLGGVTGLICGVISVNVRK